MKQRRVNILVLLLACLLALSFAAKTLNKNVLGQNASRNRKLAQTAPEVPTESEGGGELPPPSEEGGAEDGRAEDGGAEDGGAEEGGELPPPSEEGGAEDGGEETGGATGELPIPPVPPVEPPVIDEDEDYEFYECEEEINLPRVDLSDCPCQPSGPTLGSGQVNGQLREVSVQQF